MLRYFMVEPTEQIKKDAASLLAEAAVLAKTTSECDWPNQKPLINYKLDTLLGQFNDFSKKFDQVFTNQVQMSSQSQYKQNLGPYVVSLLSLITSLATMVVLLLKHS